MNGDREKLSKGEERDSTGRERFRKERCGAGKESSVERGY